MYRVRSVLASSAFTALALLVAVSHSSALAAPPAASPSPAVAMSIQPYKPAGKLSPRLQALAESASLRTAAPETRSRLLSLPANGPGSLLEDASGRPLVYIRLASLDAATLAAIARAGAAIVNVARDYGVVTAHVDPANLPALAAIPAVQNVQEEYTPASGAAPATASRAHATGGQTSEGDAQLNAATARAAYHVDGSGVTVGVLSDSYDQDGFALTDAAQDIASGDLPGPANPLGRLTPVHVISDTQGEGADEGRGMLQIVHDLAPGARLAFATAWNGRYAFAANIRALRAAGSQIIADDVAYFAEPFYQDGPISLAISDVVGSGALYFTSAGNDNLILGGHDVASYEAPAFRPTPCPASLMAQLSAGNGDSCHDFDPGPGAAPGNTIVLSNSGALQLILQWAEPFDGVKTDLDVYLADGAGNVVAWSNASSTLNQQPVEVLGYSNYSGSTQSLRLYINRYAGTGTPRLKYVLTQSSAGVQSIQYSQSNGTDSAGPTVYGHAASAYAFSVAAARFDTNDAPEHYSSRGPAVHYFGPQRGGAPADAIAPLTLDKPDFTATDGGCTTFFGRNAGSGCYRFFGTSAAAPHAAAVAALLLQEAHKLGFGLGQGSAVNLLDQTARAMSNGSQASSGAGLLDASAATLRVSQMFTVLSQHLYLPAVRR
jgi:hypothetical protein